MGFLTEDSLARESDVTVSTNVTLYAEYKGFFMYVLSAVALTMFVMWILAPHSVLLSLGISYYPDKYWAQAIPMYFLMLMFYLYVLVTLYNNEVQTLKLDDLRVFTDEHSVSPEDPVDWLWKAPSGVWDLPIGLVNEVLYGEDEDKIHYGDTPESGLKGLD
ncbi:PIG-P-domain-containing protein [Metschnikowia bicuspidata var. bicuspidata NRRL YB-4993]|uniref:PIG-P-domain-containing protein n=1 Tax=Metschnikowia bicuspidata var. bicuspidata NRRL YB-4993 TaxID=869754 RepID=A0A1A0HK67_9ASCO|nr:PIG-P-domain-containing protein [Metschnikowia bicuspidata var. bicuspidata NRRL YB-4993]OBA24396.1 PIG-P-domain-containing protein [Metschnikowia bicuspidata var. bicuspidata NRRL YB-4993]